MDGCHLVIHEGCQRDPGSEEERDILRGAMASPVQRSLFIFSRGWNTFVWLSDCVCAFWKIGNKRNWLYLCWSDSSLEIRSFFYLLHWRLHHYDENPKKLCSQRSEGAAVLQSVTSSSALLYVFGWLNDWGQPDASWSPSLVWIWISFFFLHQIKCKARWLELLSIFSFMCNAE